MVIEKEQLISLLKKKTTLDQEQVEAQLSELADHIQDAIKQGETFRVEDLGSFGISNGKLQFVPNDTLKVEINTKYAGMKPIELIGAFKEPDTDKISVTDYTDDIETDEHIDPLTFEEPTPEAEPADKTPELSAEELIPEDEQEEEKLPSKPEPATVNSAAETENKAKSKTKKSLGETQAKQKTAATSQIGTGERVVTAVVYLLILCIIGWILYDLGYIGNKNTNDAEQSFSSQTTQKPKELAPGPQDANSGTDSPQNSNIKNNAESSDTKSKASQNKQTSAQNDMTSETEKSQTFGLRGDVVPGINKAYMIVVHSRRRMDLARENKQQLKNEGYRTIINRTNVDGKVQFRVGIGQFETIEDAQQAITKLPEPYKSNNFITRTR